MINFYKATLCSSMLFMTSGCVASTARYSSDIYYSVRVRGDDALTQSLRNLLETDSKGFYFVPIDKAGPATIMIFVTDNLEVTSGSPADYVRYKVDFTRDGKLLRSSSGRCRAKKIRECRNSFLKDLRAIAQ